MSVRVIVTLAVDELTEYQEDYITNAFETEFPGAWVLTHEQIEDEA